MSTINLRREHNLRREQVDASPFFASLFLVIISRNYFSCNDKLLLMEILVSRGYVKKITKRRIDMKICIVGGERPNNCMGDDENYDKPCAVGQRPAR